MSTSYVIVTTTHRGVFYGRLTDRYDGQPVVRIEDARMVVYWSADVKSVVGLAANGPTAGCRIGPAAPAITLRDVTAVIEVSADAAKKFASMPWSM